MMDPPLSTDIQEFDADERICFSKLDNKFIAVNDEDGTEFEFDAEGRRWVPHLPAHDEAPLEDGMSARKRKSEAQAEAPESARPNKKKKKQPAPRAPKQNTAVYVTGLPLDVTVSEVHEVFSRKAGLIAEEIDSDAPRIKLYTDEQGNLKGNALVVFFKPESVELAVVLLDDTDFRISPSGVSSGRIRVQPADLSYKKVQYDNEEEGAAHGGDGQPKGQKSQQQPQQQQDDKRPRKNEKDRQKIIRKTQKLDAKLADWDDDDPYAAAEEERSGKGRRVVILKHMFTLEELEEDLAALDEIKDDVMEECSKLGTVTNVVLFDKEPEGIMTVKFQDAESADECIKVMNGRSFDGRTVEAYLAAGKERFKKSGKEDIYEDHD